MDRSRMMVALALVFTLLATILSIVNITVAMNRNPYVSESSSFLTAKGSGVALIELNGIIQDGEFGPIGADRVIRELDDAQFNPMIVGIILSMNSPGGSVGATKKIYDKVREVVKTKPVVTTISDVAASGGYYIASASDHILAYKGSVIGSIGVISIRPDISGLLEKYGVRVDAIKAGKYKDMSYPFRQLTEEEKRIYDDMLGDMFDQFKYDVSRGREQSIETVEKWAGGQVYSGQKARSIQMIDEFGGRKEAVSYIAQKVKRAPEDLQIYQQRKGFLEELMQIGSMQYASRNLDFTTTGSPSPVMYLYSDSPLASEGLLKAVLGSGVNK